MIKKKTMCVYDMYVCVCVEYTQRETIFFLYFQVPMIFREQMATLAESFEGNILKKSKEFCLREVSQ